MKHTNSISKKLWQFIILLSVIGFITGVYGFKEEEKIKKESKIEAEEKASCSNNVYNTLQMFILHHSFEHKIESEALEWSRWIIFSVFFLTTFNLFFTITAPKLLQSQIRRFPYKQRYLFVGAGEQTKILAKDLKESFWQRFFWCKRRIFLVPKEKEDDNALYNELRKMKAIVLYTNFEDDAMCFLKRKNNKFFFLEEDENFNMEMSVRLLKQLKNSKKEIHIYIRTESKEFYSYIERTINNKAEYENIEIHIFNQSDLTARLFVKNYPMLKAPKIDIDHKALRVNGEFNVLFLGFGWQGQELLKKCVCDSQFVDSKFRATIIDRDFETRYSDYPVLYDECYDECIKEYNLEFKTETVGSKEFYKWLITDACKFNRIIIALGDDNINIDTAEKITKILQKQGIPDTEEIVFARVQQLESYSEDFKAFGKLTEIYTKKVVVNEVEDEIAKMVNYVYNHEEKDFEEFTKDDKKKIKKEWKPTILFHKDSSRAVYQNIKNIMNITEGKDILKLDKKQLDIIAENEHRRWNAFHFVNGIRKWNREEINTNNAKLKDKNGNLLKHGCLVPFKELDNVSKKVNEIRAKELVEAEKKLAKLREENATEEAIKKAKKDVKEAKEKVENPANYPETDRRIVRHFPLFQKEKEQLKNKNK